MSALYLIFSYIMFSAVIPTSALLELELKVKYGKGKRFTFCYFSSFLDKINDIK